MSPLAEAHEVTVRFGALTALDAVSVAVEAGEVVGLLGANGAGKTTLIRVLLGLMRAHGGQARLFGDAPSRRTRRRVGYVPQTLGLYDDLTVGENWAFATRSFRVTTAQAPAVVAGSRAQLVGRLPLGLQRRVAFAVALSHRPELLVLDEPTSGVAPLGRARLWQDVRASAERGAGVLVTTHSMEEAEQCDRLVVMVDGAVRVEGTVGSVVGARTVVEVRAPEWQRAFAALDGSGLEVQLRGTSLRADGSLDTVRATLDSAGVQAVCSEVRAELEEAFVAIVSQHARP